MEALIIYFLKATALLSLFYVVYHVALSRLTFFQANRWFLLGGLVVSATLPLCYRTKMVWVKAVKMAFTPSMSDATASSAPAAEAFDFAPLAFGLYAVVSVYFLAKIVVQLTSLMRLIKGASIVREGKTVYVEVNQEIAPFSFFSFIVYNPNQFNASELQAVITHERMHCKQLHSLDVLFMQLYAAVFWANPLIRLYRQSMNQNLEYIADQQAVTELSDVESYQQTLIRFVCPEYKNQLTHSFYQSLIKKRIVMLHSNQSTQRSAWRYALVIPFLYAFFALFQTEVIAQTKREVTQTITQQSVKLTISKDDSEEQIQKDFDEIKAAFGTELKFSKVKRNDKGEITAIKVKFKDKKGSGEYYVDGEEKPIKTICFYNNEDGIGIGPLSAENGMATEEKNKLSVNKISAIIEMDSLDESKKGDISKMIAKIQEMNDGDQEEPLIIINGKKVSGADLDEVLSENDVQKHIVKSIKINKLGNGNKKKVVVVDSDDIDQEVNKAIKEALSSLKDMKLEFNTDDEAESTATEKSNAKAESQVNKSYLDEAKKEMAAARKEMEEARKEMEVARKEMKKWQDENKAKSGKTKKKE
ncbi:MAG: hypothetical protein CFE24_11300 [Flavobacterium sp. BFFFF2]|nr:MAG: hypothetical protein CFE24_11300 [Flavobacterium sp. BFFFF2]